MPPPDTDALTNNQLFDLWLYGMPPEVRTFYDKQLRVQQMFAKVVFMGGRTAERRIDRDESFHELMECLKK